jgi:hypothetical protein
VSTLADAAARANCVERLSRLTPESPRRWGKMTAHQMVCHLNDSFQVACGERQASSAVNLFSRTVMKWFALRPSIPWPHGVATRPEIEQGRGGTPPGDWSRDIGDLARRIRDFGDRREFGVHPIFGPSSPHDWLVWGHRQVDHHLRQFGV